MAPCRPQPFGCHGGFDHDVLEFDHGVLELDHDLLEFDRGVLEFDHDLIEFDHGAIEFDRGVLEFDHDVLEFDHAVLEFDYGVLEFDHAVLEFDYALLEFDCDVLEFDYDVHAASNPIRGNSVNPLGATCYGPAVPDEGAASLMRDGMSLYSDGMSDAGPSRLRVNPQPVPKIGKAERTRAAILDAAVGFLWSRPFRDMTVNALMESAGMSRSAFYQYFSDLHDLMRTLQDLLQGEIFAAAEPWIGGTGDPVSLMHETMAGLVRVCHRQGPFIRALSDAATTDEIFEEAWQAVPRSVR